MSADKYPSIFSRQMATIVYLSRDKFNFIARYFTLSVSRSQNLKMALLRYALNGLFLFGIIHLSSAGLPPYISNGLLNTLQRNVISNYYFSLDLAYSEILTFLLCFNGIEISLRQLPRVLRRQGLRKRKDHSDIREISNAIET